jgi:hypothetical protein
MCVCVCSCVYIHIHMQCCTCEPARTPTLCCACSVCVRVCVCICTYLHIYIYIYIYTYIHTHIHTDTYVAASDGSNSHQNGSRMPQEGSSGLAVLASSMLPMHDSTQSSGTAMLLRNTVARILWIHIHQLMTVMLNMCESHPKRLAPASLQAACVCHICVCVCVCLCIYAVLHM